MPNTVLRTVDEQETRPVEPLSLSSRLRARLDGLLPLPLYLILIVIVVVPLAYLVYAAFQTGSPLQPDAAFTLDNIAAIWRDPTYFRVLRNTLWMSLIVTVCSLVIGIALAWLVARTDLPFKRAFEVLVPLPLFLSPFACAVAWMILGSKNAGFLNVWFAKLFGTEAGFTNILSFPGLVFVMVLFHIPYAYLYTVAPLKNMDGALEEASRVGGASVATTMFRVTLPVVFPGVLSAALMVFVLSAEMFTVPALLGTPAGYPTLAPFIYQQTKFSPPNWGAASAAALLLLAVMVVGVVLQNRATRMSNRFVTVTGKGVRPATLRLGRWRWAGFALPSVYLLLSVVLPIGTLAVVTFMKYVTPNFSLELFTLRNWEILLGTPTFSRGLQNTVVIALVGSVVATVLAFLLVYSWRRMNAPFRRTTETVAMLPVAVPGIVLGVGVLWAFVRSPLYGSIWLLIMAFVARYLANPVRIFSSTMVQIDRGLEEASRVAGAGMFRTMGRVSAPLLLPAAMSGWLLLIILFTRELNIAVMIYSGSSITLPVIMWGAIEGGELSFAAIIALVETAFILTAFVVARFVFKVDLNSSRG